MEISMLINEAKTLFNEFKYEPKEFNIIAEYFVENDVNLLYGKSYVGKTVTTIKWLNKHNIVPIHLDFDDNYVPMEELGYCALHLSGHKVAKGKDKFKPKDLVIIVDTWREINKYFNSEEETIDYLKSLAKNNTIILIAHTHHHSNKTNEPEINQSITNHLQVRLQLFKGREQPRKGVETINLKIEKLRGYNGSNIVYRFREKLEDKSYYRQLIHLLDEDDLL